jgi:hypothetical protein
MDLLLDIALAVLGKIIGHRLQAQESTPNIHWYTKLLYTLLILTTLAGMFTSLGNLPLAIFFLAGDGQQPWQEWFYFGFFLLLPLFNISIFIWARRPKTNPWTMAAVLGMVISANLPIWMSLWTSWRDSTAIFVFCLLTFLASVTLFILARDLAQTPPKPKRNYHITKEPTFLSGFDNRQASKHEP